MILKTLIDSLLHIDKSIGLIVQTYGTFAYGFLFVIIFLETGLVIAPFLPGDSLIFAVGALASKRILDVWILFILICSAAIIGDSVNYAIGHFLGPRVFKQQSRIFKKEYLERTQTFYEQYGGKTILIARFIPIIRTFAPFVAGIGSMNYLKFIIYNVVGGVLWTGLFLVLGYFFGELPFVRDNFGIVIIGIILISLIPLFSEIIRGFLRKKRVYIKSL